MCLANLYKNHNLKVKLWCVGARRKKKSGFFVSFNLSKGSFFLTFVFISMYSKLNKLSEYIYFYISKNITSYTFLLVFKLSKASSVALIYVKWKKTFMFSYSFKLKTFHGHTHRHKMKKLCWRRSPVLKFLLP